MIFLADTLGYYEYDGGPAAAIEHAVQFPLHDPFPLIPIMGRVTQHVGLAVTGSAQYVPPYQMARTLATLDHLTEGRVGWNVVTAYGTSSARNFGVEDLMDHDERYRRADEYMEVVYKLWDCWDNDAILNDRAGGRYADPSRVHTIDHRGEFFECQGPLSVTASPQGRPVILQAGASPAGVAFAAKHAEVHFAVRYSAAAMKTHHQRVNDALADQGRKPSDLKVIWQVFPFVAETETAARAAEREYVSSVSVEEALTMMSGHLGIDLAALPRDETLNNIASFGTKGILGILQMVREEVSGDLTLAEVAKEYATSWGPHVVGTPRQVADQLEDLYDEAGGDGFMLVTHAIPASLDDFVDHVVPELQRRGRARTQYRNRTMRELFEELAVI